MSSSRILTPQEAPLAASGTSELVSQSEIEQLLAQVESVDPVAAGITPGLNTTMPPAQSGAVRHHLFPKLSPFTASELRALRLRHETFIAALAARMSIHLGLEISLQMSKLEVVPFQTFTEGLSDPTYLTLLKMPPLDGICLLDTAPRLALSVVDRELGGPGHVTDETRQIGKIESTLLSPVINLIVNEWCSVWKDLVEIRPAVIGHESNSRYIATSSPDTNMLVVGIQVTVAATVDQVQIAFPHTALNPIMVKLGAVTQNSEKQEAAAKNGPAQWNSLFDNVDIEITAVLPVIELPAGEVAGIKVGDVLKFPTEYFNQVQLHLAGRPVFGGALGAAGPRRAVKIEKSLLRS